MRKNIFIKRTVLALLFLIITKDFFRLIRTGTALGGRKDIGMMSRVAKNNLSYLNDKEISSIYAYLKTKPTLKDERH